MGAIKSIGESSAELAQRDAPYYARVNCCREREHVPAAARFAYHLKALQEPLHCGMSIRPMSAPGPKDDIGGQLGEVCLPLQNGHSAAIVTRPLGPSAIGHRVLWRARLCAGTARPRPFSIFASNEIAVPLPNARKGMPGGSRRGSQEQIQIIATAIGKPMPKAAAIVDANAKSKSSSGCTLSSSGMAYSTNRKARAANRTKR